MAGSSFIKSIDCFFTYVVLTLLIVVINAAIVACIIYLLHVASPGPINSDAGKTTTPSGLNTSPMSGTTPPPFTAATMKKVQEMKKMMNMSENPCNDFYNYACGGWLSSEAVRNGPEYKMLIESVVTETNNQLFSLLEQPVKNSDPFYKSQVLKFYAVCNNTDRLKERGIAPFLDFVKTIGKFPLLDNTWIESDFNFQDVVTKLARLGFTNLFLFLKVDEKDYVLFSPEPPPPKDIQEVNRNWTEETLQLLGVNTSDTMVKEDIALMFSLEEEIAKLDENVTSSISINIKVDISYLQKSAPWVLKNMPLDVRRERCLHEVRKIFKESLSRMYVDGFYNENKTTEIKSMLSKLKKAFGARANASDWLSSETKVKIVNKIDAMREQIGYPAYLKDDNMLNERYRMIPTEEYFEAVPALARMMVGNFFKRLQPKIKNLNLWPMPATSFSPFYFGSLNMLFTPAGGLHSPLFDFDWTGSMKYGVIGSILGHEIMHGFDEDGHKMNETGDEVVNYWTKNEISTYFKRARCFVDQYNKYTVQGVKVDGNKTLDENLCDNEGIRASYKGYRDWITQQGKEEPNLSDIGLTHNQIFFVSYAQFYCNKISKRMLLLLQDEHATGEIRVLGSLRNSPDFSEAFGCKLGSPMNPKEKCSIF